MTTPSTRVQVASLSKEYVRGASSVRSWREWFTGTGTGGRADRFWALRDVSFTVSAGQMLGVIGANGAGKSTLLRLLAGIGRPTAGHIGMHGRVSGLFELGGNFLHDLTGRENAVLAAVVAGLTRREALARIDAIVRFAELAEVIDAPLRTYSTGMVMRLAFAVAVHTEPDVLLVDEFLSVGDLAFQAKCLARIRDMREKGCAVILVSHSMDQVRQMCEVALWLRKGVVVAHDAVEVVAGAYEVEMRAETIRRTPAMPARDVSPGVSLAANHNRFGSLEVEITGVTLLPDRVLASGAALTVEIGWRASRPIPSPVFSVTIRRDDGTICVDTNSQSAGVAVPDLAGEGLICIAFDRLELGAGHYFVDVGVYESAWEYAYDYHWQVYPLLVEGRSALKGVLATPARWSTSARSG